MPRLANLEMSQTVSPHWQYFCFKPYSDKISLTQGRLVMGITVLPITPVILISCQNLPCWSFLPGCKERIPGLNNLLFFGGR